MAHVFITREIPEPAAAMLREAGHEVDMSEKDEGLSKEELIAALSAKSYDAVLCLLTDTVDAAVFGAAPNAKIFANYAVGFNNIDIEEAQKRGVVVTNTPDVLTETVAEYTFALILSLLHRIPEADRFTRAGEYDGWAPMLLLGNDLRDKTLGIIGAGRIGTQVAQYAQCFGMQLAYTDLKQSPELDGIGAAFFDSPDTLLPEVDVVSLHVPLLDSTRHLMNAERLGCMKESAYIVNTSRGPVIDESALVEALTQKRIAGAALDVFENEPELAPGLTECENAIITPHIASATRETRSKMAEMAAQSIIDTLAGEQPRHVVH